MAQKPKTLSLKQKTFCQEYIIDFNGTQAAIRSKYSPKTARTQAARLLTKENIQLEILAAIKKRSERTGITQDRVVLELARIAFSDMKDFATWGKDGVTLNDSEAMTEEETRCVSEVSETETKDGGSIKFKLHDKKSALELLGKHLGMFDTKLGKLDVNLKGEVKHEHGINPEDAKDIFGILEESGAFKAFTPSTPSE